MMPAHRPLGRPELKVAPLCLGGNVFGFKAGLAPLCQRENVGVISFYALAAGFRSGKYRSAADEGKSARGKNTTAKYLNERGLRMLAALDEVAQLADLVAAAQLKLEPAALAKLQAASA